MAERDSSGREDFAMPFVVYWWESSVRMRPIPRFRAFFLRNSFSDRVVQWPTSNIPSAGKS